MNDKRLLQQILFYLKVELSKCERCAKLQKAINSITELKELKGLRGRKPSPSSDRQNIETLLMSMKPGTQLTAKDIATKCGCSQRSALNQLAMQAQTGTIIKRIRQGVYVRH